MKKIIVLALACVAGNSMAQTWTEVGEAIQLTPGQITVGNGALTSIQGRLGTDADVDLYCIKIVDEAAFFGEHRQRGH